MHMFDLSTLIHNRFATRSYRPQSVEVEKLARILEAGRLAPTGANAQPQRILVVQSDEGLAKLSQAANIYKAPLALIVCVDPSKAWTRPVDGKNIADIDATIVTDHMLLAAAAEGLNSVWICMFKPDVIRQAFDLPDNLVPVNILALGYSDAQPPAKNRRPLDELVTYESF